MILFTYWTLVLAFIHLIINKARVTLITATPETTEPIMIPVWAGRPGRATAGVDVDTAWVDVEGPTDTPQFPSKVIHE